MDIYKINNPWMLPFFQYNWEVRDELFDLCRELSTEELLRQRIGSTLKGFSVIGQMAWKSLLWINSHMRK
ncbi:hypothetical protein ASG81_10610 [Paenibacillus sp. Soil522]|nr:hypothetical protein ASG81_10610 [Paenibacillus sp. Soil522]